MKKLFLLIALSGLIISCEKNNFTLNGTIEKGVDVGDSVYLQYVEKGRPFTLGKDAVKNASFNITGKSDKALAKQVTQYLTNHKTGDFFGNFAETI